MGGAQDWHKYVDQFAGDYKKYMSQGQGGGAEGGGVESAGAQGGCQDWHKYVDQYACASRPPASLCRDLGDIRSSCRRSCLVRPRGNRALGPNFSDGRDLPV